MDAISLHSYNNNNRTLLDIEMQSTIHIILTSRLQSLFLTSSVLVAAKTLEVRVKKKYWKQNYTKISEKEMPNPAQETYEHCR